MSKAIMNAPRTPTLVRGEVVMEDGTTHRIVLTDLKEPFVMGLRNSPVETTYDDVDNIPPFRTYAQGPEWTINFQATGVRQWPAAVPAVTADGSDQEAEKET